jgi:hypothetical protein
MQDDGAVILMHMGHDFAAVVNYAPRKHVRLDQHGWLGLSGEPDCADLNMAAVVRGAPRSLLDEYLREIQSRALSAILVVDPGEESLLKAATDSGLTQVTTVPVMLRRAAPITPIPRPFTVRRATSGDVAVANDVTAEAFSLDPLVVHYHRAILATPSRPGLWRTLAKLLDAARSYVAATVLASTPWRRQQEIKAAVSVARFSNTECSIIKTTVLLHSPSRPLMRACTFTSRWASVP